MARDRKRGSLPLAEMDQFRIHSEYVVLLACFSLSWKGSVCLSVCKDGEKEGREGRHGGPDVTLRVIVPAGLVRNILFWRGPAPLFPTVPHTQFLFESLQFHSWPNSVPASPPPPPVSSLALHCFSFSFQQQITRPSQEEKVEEKIEEEKVERVEKKEEEKKDEEEKDEKEESK